MTAISFLNYLQRVNIKGPNSDNNYFKVTKSSYDIFISSYIIIRKSSIDYGELKCSRHYNQVSNLLVPEKNNIF